MRSETNVAGTTTELADGKAWFERIVDETQTPHWPEGNSRDCQHTPAEYVGTIEYVSGRSMLEAARSPSKFVDVYLRNDNGVCLRRSDDAGDYAGIPHVESLVDIAAFDAVYRHALKMILRARLPRG
jgi:hypothetical protein